MINQIEFFRTMEKTFFKAAMNYNQGKHNLLLEPIAPKADSGSALFYG
jgi:hypothetical protein